MNLTYTGRGGRKVTRRTRVSGSGMRTSKQVGTRVIMVCDMQNIYLNSGAKRCNDAGKEFIADIKHLFNACTNDTTINTHFIVGRHMNVEHVGNQSHVHKDIIDELHKLDKCNHCTYEVIFTGIDSKKSRHITTFIPGNGIYSGGFSFRNMSSVELCTCTLETAEQTTKYALSGSTDLTGQQTNTITAFYVCGASMDSSVYATASYMRISDKKSIPVTILKDLVRRDMDDVYKDNLSTHNFDDSCRGWKVNVEYSHTAIHGMTPLKNQRLVLLVDVQNDFMELKGVPLPTIGADTAFIDELVAYIEECDADESVHTTFVVSRDYHPTGHMSCPQFGVHCIQGTRGSHINTRICDALESLKNSRLHVVFKGISKTIDSLTLLRPPSGTDEGVGGFWFPDEDQSNILRTNNYATIGVNGLVRSYAIVDAIRIGKVTTIELCGLQGDVCVLKSAQAVREVIDLQTQTGRPYIWIPPNLVRCHDTDKLPPPYSRFSTAFSNELLGQRISTDPFIPKTRRGRPDPKNQQSDATRFSDSFVQKCKQNRVSVGVSGLDPERTHETLSTRGRVAHDTHTYPSEYTSTQTSSLSIECTDAEQAKHQIQLFLEKHQGTRIKIGVTVTYDVT